MDMDPCLREVRQPAGVIEMKVRHHNVLDLCRENPQPGQLANRCGIRIVTATEIEPKQSDFEGGRSVVVETQAGVYEDRAVVSVYLKTGTSNPPAGQPW